MRIEICGQPAYAMAYVYLDYGESILCERGAMAMMSDGIHAKGAMTGGAFKSLLRRFTNESFFMGEYTAGVHGAYVALAPKYPGDIAEVQIEDHRPLIVQSGSLLGHAATVENSMRINGAQAVVMQEGVTATKLRGEGLALICTYGALQSFEIAEGSSVTVDTGHLVAWTQNIKLELGLVGGVAAAAMTGEGIAARVTAVGGPGEVYVQTRSEQDIHNWLNPGRDHDTGGRRNR